MTIEKSLITRLNPLSERLVVFFQVFLTTQNLKIT